MALENHKFKKDNFRNEAEAICKAFAEQVGFNTINKKTSLQLYNSDLPTGYHVTTLENVPMEEKWQGGASNKMYFSEDLKFLERTNNKLKNQIAVYKQIPEGKYAKLVEQIATPERQALANNPVIEISELRNTQQRLKQRISFLTRRAKRLMLISVLLTVGFFTASAFL